ncbi:TonB-dependent receptor domain-containing protein [Fodinicurvata fenggangensis]|uniref:TonB-dependent receptor domain-containing protein n=1 Tax=Fodinicurvata fenggangensis TaxID=1121830 RepID=UPI0012DEF9DA|nr:TonB-dependent receptor [Fodinicurvata fenggangensis]
MIEKATYPHLRLTVLRALLPALAFLPTAMIPLAQAQETDSEATLEPIVVTATRSEQNISDAPASISVVTGEELKTAPVGDVSDAVRHLPGISLTAGSQGRREVSIRGMDSSYTLILLDGKRVNSREAVFRHNDYDLGLLPVEAIERIEVVRGGMSSLYGSDALGGVINIITKPDAQEWRGSIDTQIQSPLEGDGGQEYRSSLYLSGPIVPGKLGLTVLGGLSKREIWKAYDNETISGTDINRKNLTTLEGRQDHSGRVRLTWTPDEENTVEAEYGRSYQRRHGKFYFNSYDEMDSTVIRDDASFTHRGDWDWGQSELRAYWERSEPTSGEDKLVQNNYTLEGNISAPWGRHYFTIGGEARWVDLEAPGEFDSGGASTHQQAVYLQDDIMITEKLSLLLGARLDNNKYFGTHLTPRGYLVYRPMDALTLKGGISTGFKAPTLRQLSQDSVVTSCRGACTIEGNPDLEPETSTNYELSIAYDKPAWGTSLTVFQNDVDDLIDIPRQGDGGTYHPINIEEARIRGIEVTANHDIFDFGRVTANYTFLDARNRETDKLLSNRPRHTINGRFDWFINDRTTAFMRGEYTGQQRTYDRSGKGDDIPGYALFDIGINHRFTDSFELRGGVTNIFDTRTDDPDDDYTFNERGRTVFLGANLTF